MPPPGKETINKIIIIIIKVVMKIICTLPTLVNSKRKNEFSVKLKVISFSLQTLMLSRKIKEGFAHDN